MMKTKLSDREWKEFKIEDIFNIKGSKTTKVNDLKQLKTENDLYPYITTKATQNAVDGFYNYKTEKGNVIVFDSATVGFLSYQEKDFSASDHVEIMEPLDFELNKYIAHFIISSINKSISEKFNYGFKLSQKRMRRQIVYLPVNKLDEPDYEYMEQYIKNLMLKKYKQFKTYKETS